MEESTRKKKRKEVGMFCKKCGAYLLPGSKFCEECGFQVDSQRSNEKYFENIFSDTLWERDWLDICSDDNKRNGLIIINSCFSIPDSLYETLSDYIYFSKENCGVNYHVLDLANNAIDCFSDVVQPNQLIDVLKAVYKVKKPHYLMIIGDDTVINFQKWNNYSEDGDAEVFADLPFLTLSTCNPFELFENDVKNWVPVGRIPASPDDGYQLAIDYFVNTMQAINQHSSATPMGLSALVWKNESESIFSKISNIGLACSPTVTTKQSLNDISGGKPNILYFNLHGSDDTKYWYGQDMFDYPEAVEPNEFISLGDGYFVGVEACYGAAYSGREDSESILKTALKHGCLSFLGSSKIAYGASEEPGCCADIMVGSFIRYINENQDAGHAYLNSIVDLLSVPDIDDATIKTLAEFSLYGDPSIKKNYHSDSFGIYGNPLSQINVMIPDIKHAVKLSYEEVNQKIKQVVDSYVFDKYKQFVNATSKTFSFGNNDLLQSIYCCSDGVIKQYLKVFFDSKTGKIIRECVSK